MARMKHMKQQSRPASKRGAPESSGKLPPLGRDRAFKAALMKEYGVSEVPRKLHRRTEKTLENLPDTLPVRQRPVLWAVKSAATVMAVLAVSFAALLGLNTTHPQLTEALPGVGRVFAAMNGGGISEPSPSPSPSPQPEQYEFQPVTVLSQGDFPGVLSIDDAWSDGRTLVLDLSVSPYEEFYEELSVQMGYSYEDGLYNYLALSPSTVQYTDGGDSCGNYIGVLAVSSDGSSRGFEDGFVSFTPDGSGKFTARWQLDLAGMSVGSELSVTISLPDITAYYSINDSYGSTSWYAGFETKFTLPVSTGGNRVLAAQAADGPVTLLSVDYAPSRVELDVSMPYLGMPGDLLIEGSGYDGDAPLGTYAQLTCMSEGREYDLIGGLTDCSDTEGLTPGGSTRLDVHYTFTATNDDETPHPRELKGPLVLTLYEFPQYDGRMGRVMAEFTIDLSTGRSYPSENYLKYGYEMGDPQKTTAQRLEDLCADMGFYMWPAMNGLDMMRDYPNAQFQLVAPVDQAGRTLVLNGYMDGKIAQNFTFVLGEDAGTDGVGTYYTGYYDITGGDEYFITYVTMFIPDWMYYDDYSFMSFERLELIDADTGKVLAEDLGDLWAKTSEELYWLPREEQGDTASTAEQTY